MDSIEKTMTSVIFHGDELLAIREGEKVWVVFKRACEALGVAEQRQAEKLKEKAWARTTLKVAHDASGRNQEVLCLDLDSLPMWLASIEPKRVKEAAREKLVLYQLECARVLRDHFFAKPAAEIVAPKTLLEVLETAAAIERERMRLVDVIEVQKPKVEAHDRFLDTSDNFTLSHLAKACGTTVHKLNTWLRAAGYLHKHHKDNPPNDVAIKRGLLVVVNRGFTVESEDDGVEHRTRPQTRVTPLGMTVLSAEFSARFAMQRLAS